jgi:hypothetical protein
MKGPAVLALAVLAVLALGGPAKAAPPPKPPARLPPPDKGAMVPYVPTPPAVAKRAAELLGRIPLGDEKIESDPTGTYPTVAYRAEWHSPSATNPKHHKGISVYRGGRRE